MTTFVKRKEKESFEAMLRRFTRMVISSKTIINAKERRFLTKGPSKRELRESTLRRERIRVEKQKELY